MSWPRIRRLDDYEVTRDFVRGNLPRLSALSDASFDDLAPEIASAQLRMEEYERWNPGVTFEPWREDGKFYDGVVYRSCYHPGQAEAFSLLAGGVRFLIITSGNRWGKTLFAGKVITDHVLSEPDRLVLVDGGSFQSHRDDIQKALWQVRVASEFAKGQKPWNPGDGLGKDDPKMVYHRQTWPKDVPSGRIIFRSYEQPSVKLGGIDATLIVDNEPPPMAHLHEQYLRVATREGKIIIAATFVTADEVYEHCMRAVDDHGDRLWFHMTGVSTENPTFSKEEERRIINTLEPDEAKARLEGKPITLGGRCYWAFQDRAPWVIPEDLVPNRRDLDLYEGIDCHPTKPLAYLLWGVDRRGVIWALDELWWRGEQRR